MHYGKKPSKAISISVMVEMPSPEKSGECKNPIDMFKEKVYDYITMCESPIKDSEYEWKYLKSVYKKLCEKPKLSPELAAIKEDIEILLSKNAGSEPVPLDSKYMGKAP